MMIVRDGKIDLREFRRNGLEMEQFRTMLRENGIFSMLEVDDVRFETNGPADGLAPAETARSLICW